MNNEHKGSATGVWALSVLLLFAVQTVFMHETLIYAAQWGEALAVSGLYTLVFAGALAVFIRMRRPARAQLIFVSAVMAVLMLARVCMLDFETADYVTFLTEWVKVFRDGGFATLAQNVGDYNLLYQYLLLLVSRAPLHDIYLIKLITVIFDYALALAMMRAAEHFAGREMGVPVLLCVLCLPTVVLDGACWAQCDPVYICFIILSLYWLKTGRPYRAAIAVALAFAFKLQTIFFFPVVLLGLIHGEYKPRHALAFFVAYLVTMIPALIAGRPFIDALAVYANQSMGQYYDRLTYNAPNLYLFFPMLEFASSQEATWMRFIEGIDGKATNPYLTDPLMPDLQTAALYACVILTLIVVVYWLLHAHEVTPDMTLDVALFFALFLPFVMPKIHDRYFFLADMLSVLYAARYAGRRYLPALVIGASLMSYMPFLTRQRPVDERWLALMMLAALLIVGHDILVKMRKNRAALAREALAKGGEAA